MPTTPVTPYVPQYITVHLGAPSARCGKCDGFLPGIR